MRQFKLARFGLFAIVLLIVGGACGFVGAGSTEEIVESHVRSDGSIPPPETIALAEYKMLDGETFNIREAKGKVILINLWATWCGPCRREMPDLVELQDQYREEGFQIIGLDTDPETEHEIEEFAAHMKLNYRLGWADTASVREFMNLAQMPAIPLSFLINREGRLVGIFRGGSPREIKKLKEIVAELMTE